MKKYIIPSITVVEMKCDEEILTGSQPNTLNNTYSGSQQLSKEMEYFDDEEF